jgi:serine/threonine protein kinase
MDLRNRVVSVTVGRGGRLVNQVEKRSHVVMTPGTVVAGKYRIARTLAEGGMGVVALASHIHLQQSVAIKFLRKDISTEWDALARFRGEAKAVAQLRSEHVGPEPGAQAA